MPVTTVMAPGPYTPAAEGSYDALHEDFYHRVLDGLGTKWLGVPLAKSPLDLWIMQELICEIRPELIIEVGTGMGGSGLFLASICELLDRGCVLSVDRMNLDWPTHDRLTHLQGECTDWHTARAVHRHVVGKEVVMVDLDADHARDAVYGQMLVYGEFVTAGSALIVEDSNMNGHPMGSQYGPGPWEAVRDYLADFPDSFVRDVDCERYGFTFNPGGFLRKLPL